MTLATQVGADDKVTSGMLACSSNENNMAPIIYAFDGEHLLRDNQLENPFEKIASLSNTTDLYFAFVPRKIVKLKADAAKSLTEKPDLVRKKLESFLLFCQISSRNTNFRQFQFTEKANNEVHLPDMGACGSTLDKLYERLAEYVKPSISDYDHVKLTLDFANLKVVEEIYSPYSPQEDRLTSRLRRGKTFQHNLYTCKSLGVTIPKIDTSQSLAPIGKDL